MRETLRKVQWLDKVALQMALASLIPYHEGEAVSDRIAS